MKTMDGVKDIRKIITDSVEDANKSSLPPPKHLMDAMAVLEIGGQVVATQEVRFN